MNIFILAPKVCSKCHKGPFYLMHTKNVVNIGRSISEKWVKETEASNVGIANYFKQNEMQPTSLGFPSKGIALISVVTITSNIHPHKGHPL